MSHKLDDSILKTAKSDLLRLEKLLSADVLFLYVPIVDALDKLIRNTIEKLSMSNKSKALKRIAIILNTNGGYAETAEKWVNLFRHHYDEVFFLVPDYAMSAGTILCLAGDKIYMDYSSSLGPVDPQIKLRNSSGDLVSALGYLDHVEKLIAKSRKKILTNAELAMLLQLDLAFLSSLEQARELTNSLLREWLVKYKFANWKLHRSDPDKKGKPVTINEKRFVANRIAKQLGDNKLWHSHGRCINIDTLKNVLKLEIENLDDPGNGDLKTVVRSYNDLLMEYASRQSEPFFIHCKLGERKRVLE